MLDLSWINSAGIDIEFFNPMPLPLNETSALEEVTSLVEITVKNISIFMAALTSIKIFDGENNRIKKCGKIFGNSNFMDLFYVHTIYTAGKFKGNLI